MKLERKILRVYAALEVCPVQLNAFDKNFLLSILRADVQINTLTNRERKFYETCINEKDTQIN